MANLVSALAAILSFSSLVLVAIAMATNSWVRFDYPRPNRSATSVNPIVSNSKLSGLTLTYDLDYFGLWVGCHRELQFNKTSCAFIGSSCYSNVCWTRNGNEKVCLDAPVGALSRCTGYRVVRAFTIIGTLFLILGAAVLLVSICVTSRNLVFLGTLFTSVGALCLMIAFAVFYTDVFRGGQLFEVSSLGWSFVLLIVAWPVAVVGAVIGLLGAFVTPSKGYEFDESE